MKAKIIIIPLNKKNRALHFILHILQYRVQPPAAWLQLKDTNNNKHGWYTNLNLFNQPTKKDKSWWNSADKYFYFVTGMR